MRKKDKAEEEGTGFVIVRCLRNRSGGPYQPFFTGPQRGDGQIIATFVKSIDVDAPVSVRLLKPVLQDMLEVNTLPVADPGVQLNLEGADSDVAAALLCNRFQPQDLQVDGGGLLKWPQIHPQLSLENLGEHKLGAKLEEATAWFSIHLHQWFRC